MSTATLTPAESAVPRINDTAPDFTAETTEGTIRFHEWIGNGWAVLFSHPKDFTPVCTTELGAMAKLQPEFAKRNTKILALSVDQVSDHKKWQGDIEETQGAKVNYPMIGDPQLKIAKLYGMLPASAGDTSQGRTPNDNATVRTVFVLHDLQIQAISAAARSSYMASEFSNHLDIFLSPDRLKLIR